MAVSNLGTLASDGYIELHNHFSGILPPDQLIALAFGSANYAGFINKIWQNNVLKSNLAIRRVLIKNGLIDSSTDQLIINPESLLIQDAATTLLTANDDIEFGLTYVIREQIIRGIDPLKYVEAVLNNLKAQGISYVEVQLDKLPGGISYEEFKQLLEKYKLDVRFLVNISTKTLRDSPKGVEKTKNTTFGGNGYVGVDFAGPEEEFKALEGKIKFQEVYRALKEKAENQDISLVIRPHVGEGFHLRKGDTRELEPNSNHRQIAQNNIQIVIGALEGLKESNELSDRIIVRFGHATHALPGQLEKMKALGVIVEANLTSNLVTKSVANEDEQAQVLLKFLYYGLEVVLNTDGGGVMKTTIKREYERASEIIERFKTKNDLQIIEDNKRIYYDENTAPPLNERKSEYIYEPLPAERKENFTMEYLKKQAEEYKKNDVPKLPR